MASIFHHGSAPLSWDARGNLPVGDHELTLDGLRSSLLVHGDGSADWDRPGRARLASNFAYLVGHLHRIGIDEVYADGSFATSKASPGDIDAYFVTDFPGWTAQLKRLQAIDATWTYDLADRLPNHEGKLKWPQWHRYRIEFFYVFRPPFDHLSFMGTQRPPVTIDRYFREDAAGHPRGLIRIIL